MARRDLGQYCGLARALELVGERWSPLIVRDVLAGPHRLTDLPDGLPGISTNVLSTRLTELEGDGLVERRIALAPQRGVLCAMTEAGQQIEPAMLALAACGTSRLVGPRPGEFVPATTLALTLRATFDRAAAAGVTAAWELQAPGIVVHAVLTDGTLTTGDGPAPVPPDLVMTLTPDELPSFQVLVRAARSGQVELQDLRKLLDTFFRVFAPQPAA